MPELPEVQTTVNGLRRRLVGRRVVSFWTDWPRSIRGLTPAQLRRGIEGLEILKIGRLGKNVLVSLAGGHRLLIHQKMTGHLMVGRWSIRRVGRGWLVKSLVAGPLNERTNQYIHAIFTLDSGDMLALSDLRKFARIDFGKKEYILGLPAIYRLGPDALSRHLTPEVFRNAVGGRKKSIKQALMDPSVIAGIGNIYADDILWSARIHPARRADTLSRAELDRILTYTRKILRTAIRLGGTSISDYRNPSGGSGKYGRAILVYRRAGHPCPRCGKEISRIVLGQRSAHFCPSCQRL